MTFLKSAALSLAIVAAIVLSIGAYGSIDQRQPLIGYGSDTCRVSPYWQTVDPPVQPVPVYHSDYLPDAKEIIDNLRKQVTNTDSDQAKVYKHLLASTVTVKVYGNDKEKEFKGHGSGFIVHGTDGETYVWTAGHVLAAGADEDHKYGRPTISSVIYEDQSENDVGFSVINEVKVLALSPFTEDDLCILKLSKKGYGVSAVLAKESPKLGDRLILSGAAAGSERGPFVSEGTLGRKGVKVGAGYMDHFNGSAMQGTSGGPLCDAQGRVVGVMSRGKGETNSIFVPVNRMVAFAKKHKLEAALGK